MQKAAYSGIDKNFGDSPKFLPDIRKARSGWYLSINIVKLFDCVWIPFLTSIAVMMPSFWVTKSSSAVPRLVQ